MWSYREGRDRAIVEDNEPSSTHPRPLRPKTVSHCSAKKSGVVKWFPRDASTIETLDQELGQLSIDCMCGWQTSFRVPHSRPLGGKNRVSRRASTYWWDKSKVC